MVEMTIKLANGLARALGDSSETRARRLTEHAVIEEYRAGKLSHREVGEALGLDYWGTEEFFKKRGVALNYTAADLENDRETLAGMMRSE